MATPTDDNTADGNLDKHRVQLIWRRYTREGEDVRTKGDFLGLHALQ